ncbi:hypothetical protein POSPLADRAFT_1149833, partial [Postia placenta MAD-698-R-SB12]
LCHAHVHLDKCFLLDQCDDLVTGDFAEALKVTAKAKRTFLSNPTDVHARGRRLITQSVECGVTAMRAHVEVDETVAMTCLDTGLRLKREYSSVCDIQVAVFAQDPFFSNEEDSEPGVNLSLFRDASLRDGVGAVGSAPYVEPSIPQAKCNITYVLDIAHARGLHADFHLDYNLDPASEPLIWFLLDELRARIAEGRWHAGMQVCVGHATRLALFSGDEWARFRREVEEHALPIMLVGLPPSDLYMMGRGAQPAQRGTLNILRLAERGVRAAMAVNNVGNAFTPQGPLDPLALCPLGVAVFQNGTKDACQTLVEAVTVNARTAIGVPGPRSLMPAIGGPADFVLLHDNDSMYSAALDPSYSRTTIKGGVVVAKRYTSRWLLHEESTHRSPVI